MQIKSQLSKNSVDTLSEYKFSMHCLGALILFKDEPGIKQIDSVRSFLNNITDDILWEQL